MTGVKAVPTVALTALLVGWLALASGTSPASGGTTTQDEPRILDAVKVTDDETAAPGRSFTSPSMVVDPADPSLVYAASVDVRTQRCTLLRSSDAGRTWSRSDASPSPASHPFCTTTTGFVPMAFLEIGQSGTLYYLHNGWALEDDGADGDNRSVFLARSTDQGETWQSTAVRDNRGKQGNDIERDIAYALAVDSSGKDDVVYVGYSASFPVPKKPSRPAQALIAVSEDGGSTFSGPIDLTAGFFEDKANYPAAIPDGEQAAGYFGSSSPTLTVDDAGTLFAGWSSRTANVTPSPPSALYLSTSSDRGANFQVQQIQAGDKANTGMTGPMLRWSPAGGEAGSLHLVWEGKEPITQGDRDVLYRRSLDGGATWSTTTVVNDDDPTQLYGQYTPNMDVAPNGRLDVVWWDQRDAAGAYGTDVYYASSSDAGESWSANQRMTDRLIDRTIGVWAPGTGGDVRQPPGLASSDAMAHVVWDDTRNGNEVTQTQDLYGASVQYSPLAATGFPKALGYVLAAALGIALVGLIAVVGMKLMGRRRPLAGPSAGPPAGPSATPSDAKRTSVAVD